MKGKRIILMMLTALCAASNAYAAELIIENGAMDYAADAYKAEIHHSGKEVRPITVQMKNSVTNESRYFSEFLTDENGDLSLKLPMNSEKNPSGEYTIRISGADIDKAQEIAVVYPMRRILSPRSGITDPLLRTTSEKTFTAWDWIRL